MRSKEDKGREGRAELERQEEERRGEDSRGELGKAGQSLKWSLVMVMGSHWLAPCLA